MTASNDARVTPIQETTFAVVDVETTGFDPDLDRVVEVACIVLRGGSEVERYTTLVDPQRPIPAVASAVHHITNGHVAGAPALAAVRPVLASLCRNAVVVAHNAAFDLRFLPFLADRPVLCSMRFAQRMISDAPNYKNQVLRYHLGFDQYLDGSAAHRALGDVEVTSRILRVCIERYLASGAPDDVRELVRRIAAPRRLKALPFGRHRGIELGLVPSDYLRWLVSDAALSADVRITVDTELTRRHAIAS